ncbi:MAG: cyclic nucleotide-binding domain-containing protein [Candidatus Binatia bacterium]
MSLWERILVVADMGEAFGWVVVLLPVTALVLFVLLPEERTAIRTAMIFFALSLAGLFAAAFLLSPAADQQSVAYRSLRWIALFFESVAIITIGAILLFDVVLKAVSLAPPRILRDLMVALSYIVVAIMLLSRNGVDLTGIVATSAVVTAIIGFSLQDTLGNIMGGMALQMERSIAIGDWIRIDDHEGRVTEIRWRQTSIETRNWDTVVIPNSVLMRSRVTLLGHRQGMPRQRRQWIYFNVDFRFPPTEVIAAVEAALGAEPIAKVAAEPPPNCVLVDFQDSYASYAVRYWLTDFAVDDPTNSVVRSRIFAAIRRRGFSLSIPAQAVFVTQDDPSRRERKQAKDFDQRLAVLGRVELFRTLNDAERRHLAEGLSVAPFVRGEAMTRKGATAHWLYIINQGEAEVRLDEDGIVKDVAKLGAGDFFGEMALMTGALRSATVIAASDVECYRLDKATFQEVLKQRPELAEDVSHVLARRRVELQAAREGLSDEAKRHRLAHEQGDLLHRIRKFFSLKAI